MASDGPDPVALLRAYRFKGHHGHLLKRMGEMDATIAQLNERVAAAERAAKVAETRAATLTTLTDRLAEVEDGKKEQDERFHALEKGQNERLQCLESSIEKYDQQMKRIETQVREEESKRYETLVGEITTATTRIRRLEGDYTTIINSSANDRLEWEHKAADARARNHRLDLLEKKIAQDRKTWDDAIKKTEQKLALVQKISKDTNLTAAIPKVTPRAPPPATEVKATPVHQNAAPATKPKAIAQAPLLVTKVNATPACQSVPPNKQDVRPRQTNQLDQDQRLAQELQEGVPYRTTRSGVLFSQRRDPDIAKFAPRSKRARSPQPEASSKKPAVANTHKPVSSASRVTKGFTSLLAARPPIIQTSKGRQPRAQQAKKAASRSNANVIPTIEKRLPERNVPEPVTTQLKTPPPPPLQRPGRQIIFSPTPPGFSNLGAPNFIR